MTKICDASGCDNAHYSLGKCRPHYRKIARPNSRKCEFENCDRPHQAKGLCKMHYKRQDQRHHDYAKEWFSKNRKRANQLSKDWVKRNPEKRKKAALKYYYSNREKYYVHTTARRSRIKSAHREPWDRFEIAERDNWTCGICKTQIENMPKEKYRDPMYLNIDHIIPISKGGDDAPHNLQAAHASCNKKKWVKHD